MPAPDSIDSILRVAITGGIFGYTHFPYLSGGRVENLPDPLRECEDRGWVKYRRTCRVKGPELLELDIYGLTKLGREVCWKLGIRSSNTRRSRI